MFCHYNSPLQKISTFQPKGAIKTHLSVNTAGFGTLQMQVAGLQRACSLSRS